MVRPSGHVFRKMDEMATELRHERRLREVALETARRSIRDREKLVTQIREVRGKAAFVSESDTTLADLDESRRHSVQNLVSELDALADDIQASQDGLADSIEEMAVAPSSGSHTPHSVGSDGMTYRSSGVTPRSCKVTPRAPPVGGTPRAVAAQLLSPGSSVTASPPPLPPRPPLEEEVMQVSSRFLASASSRAPDDCMEDVRDTRLHEVPCSVDASQLDWYEDDEVAQRVAGGGQAHASVPRLAVLEASTSAAVPEQREPPLRHPAAAPGVCTEDIEAPAQLEAGTLGRVVEGDTFASRGSFVSPGCRVWQPNTQDCQICRGWFTPLNPRHHCRQCGANVCEPCSPFRVTLAEPLAVPSGALHGLRSLWTARSGSERCQQQAYRVCSACMGDPPPGGAPGTRRTPERYRIHT